MVCGWRWWSWWSWSWWWMPLPSYTLPSIPLEARTCPARWLVLRRRCHCWCDHRLPRHCPHCHVLGHRARRKMTSCRPSTELRRPATRCCLGQPSPRCLPTASSRTRPSVRYMRTAWTPGGAPTHVSAARAHGYGKLAFPTRPCTVGPRTPPSSCDVCP